MTEKQRKIYQFDSFRLDVAEQTLVCEDKTVSLSPKIFDLLVLLVENQGHLLGKEEIIQKLWADSFVEEANLNVTVSALRRALGEKPNENRYIETVPRRGYRFVAAVSEIAEEATQAEQPETEKTFAEAKTVPFGLNVRRCPKCRKVYTGEALNYCLDDGEILQSAETKSSDSKSSKTFNLQNKLHVWLAVAGILAAVIFGILVWKFGFQPPKAEVSNIRTIAVLPFKPLTREKTDEALQMGIADALITKLSSLQQIIVRPTSAVSKYSETETDPITAGRELQVEAVLDGKIQRADNKIRVTVQLLRVSDGATLWAGSFDDFFTNIFAVQDSISEKMTSLLALKMSAKEEKLLTKRYTENTEAYTLFLQARYFHEKLDKENTLKALEFYQAAIDKDPNYAMAYSSRSGAFGMLANLNINREENMQKARDTVLKALSLDPNLGDACASLADIQMAYDWNFAEAEKNYRKAIGFAPNEADTHLEYANFLTSFGRHDEAVKEAERAVQINPVAPYVLSVHLQTLILARRFDEAVVQGRKAFELMPNERQIVFGLMKAYIYKLMFADAEALLPRFLELNPTGDFTKAVIYLNTGRRAEGEKILRERLAKYKEGDNCFQNAIGAGILGDKERTFEFLEKAVKRREPSVTLMAVIPEFDGLHSDPRFQDLLRRIGLPSS